MGQRTSKKSRKGGKDKEWDVGFGEGDTSPNESPSNLSRSASNGPASVIATPSISVSSPDDPKGTPNGSGERSTGAAIL